MIRQAKPVVSLTTLVVLGLTLTCTAQAEVTWGKQRTDEQIQTCVAEISKHASYTDATRVIHRVTELDQRNLIELEIRVETSVYGLDDSAAISEYSVSCITGYMGDLVKFRINDLERDVAGSRDKAHS